MDGEVVEGTLWTPSREWIEATTLTRFTRWVEAERGVELEGYDELWAWSVADVEGFWSAVATFFEVPFARPPDRILGPAEMPGATWFPGA